MWDKKTPESVVAEAVKHARLHAQKCFPENVESQETSVSTVLTLLEEMKQVCTKNFDEAFEAIYGEQGNASNPSLYNLPQWSLFWAMLLQLPSFYERQSIKTNLALDWQESFDALHALKDTDRETLYDLAREKDFFPPPKV